MAHLVRVTVKKKTETKSGTTPCKCFKRKASPLAVQRKEKENEKHCSEQQGTCVSLLIAWMRQFHKKRRTEATNSLWCFSRTALAIALLSFDFPSAAES
jgi:hypothetical protein